jgi:hypothetical protein
VNEIASFEKVSLKDVPGVNEAWLQDQIAADPAILELGDLDVIERERVQVGAGRLDLQLQDTDRNTRYEVELMLGATDPSHIIRCIEYWDIERRRYPAYDHIAVLVAEEVTTRFLNVMSLLAGSIPLIAIQLSVLKVEGKILLHFVRVLDQSTLRADDTVETDVTSVDRAHWEGKVGVDVIGLCDRVLTMINETSSTQQELVYRRSYIGISAGLTWRHFVLMRPRQSIFHLGVWVDDVTGWMERLGEAGLAAEEAKSRGRLKVSFARADFDRHEGVLRELVHQAVADHEAVK